MGIVAPRVSTGKILSSNPDYRDGECIINQAWFRYLPGMEIWAQHHNILTWGNGEQERSVTIGNVNKRILAVYDKSILTIRDGDRVVEVELCGDNDKIYPNMEHAYTRWLCNELKENGDDSLYPYFTNDDLFQLARESAIVLRTYMLDPNLDDARKGKCQEIIDSVFIFLLRFGDHSMLLKLNEIKHLIGDDSNTLLCKKLKQIEQS